MGVVWTDLLRCAEAPAGRDEASFPRGPATLDASLGCLLGARVRHSAHGKGHEEGGSTYAKAGSSLRSPPGNPQASTPITRAGEQTFLSQEDKAAVLLLGKSLGYLDKTQQESSIRLLLRYIEEARQQGRTRLEKNGKLYYGLGCLSGLLMVVILL